METFFFVYVISLHIKKSDIPQAGRFGAPDVAAGRGRARLGANRTIRLGNKKSTVLSKPSKNVASTSPQKHEKAKSYVNRRRNKISG